MNSSLDEETDDSPRGRARAYLAEITVRDCSATEIEAALLVLEVLSDPTNVDELQARPQHDPNGHPPRTQQDWAAADDLATELFEMGAVLSRAEQHRDPSKVPVRVLRDEAERLGTHAGAQKTPNEEPPADMPPGEDILSLMRQGWATGQARGASSVLDAYYGGHCQGRQRKGWPTLAPGAVAASLTGAESAWSDRDQAREIRAEWRELHRLPRLLR